MICVKQLAFVMCLTVGSHRLTDRLTLQVQDSCDLPWTRWQQLQSTQHGMRAFQHALGWLRKQLRVLL